MFSVLMGCFNGLLLMVCMLQDKGLRELAADALSALVKYDPEYFASYAVEKLIPCTLSSDLCMRHGATLAVGEVVLALHQCGHILPSGLYNSFPPLQNQVFHVKAQYLDSNA